MSRLTDWIPRVGKQMGKSGHEQKTFFFLSGLPRSGSTVLASILSQNPRIFVTPTSPLLDMLCLTEGNWQKASRTADPDPVQIRNISKGLIQSIYAHVDRPIIIDKHRGWPRNIQTIQGILGYPPKILCTVRDVPDVLASYILLCRRQQGAGNFVDQHLLRLGMPLTDEARCELLMREYLSNAVESISIGLRSSPNSLHLIEYEDLMRDPATVLDGIYRFLDILPHTHDFDGIVNPVPEKDEFWGMPGLHDIRPKLGRSSPPAIGTLGEAIYRKYANRGLEFWREK